MCFTSRTITITVYYYVRKILYACKADTERHIIYLVWKWMIISIETRLLLVCARISPRHLQIASILLISGYSYFWRAYLLCRQFSALHNHVMRLGS